MNRVLQLSFPGSFPVFRAFQEVRLEIGTVERVFRQEVAGLGIARAAGEVELAGNLGAEQPGSLQLAAAREAVQAVEAEVDEEALRDAVCHGAARRAAAAARADPAL